MKNKKLILIIILIVIALAIFAIFYTKILIKLNDNREGNWFLNLKKENGEFFSSDKKISFKFPRNVRLERKNSKTMFWIVEDAGGDIGDIAAFGFNFEENRLGEIDELYKENKFYKENPKNFYGKNSILVFGHPAIVYNFCDMNNCTDQDMVREIFIKYDNKIYSFEFGVLGQKLQQEILYSVKFN